jgi:hypothetical protein
VSLRIFVPLWLFILLLFGTKFKQVFPGYLIIMGFPGVTPFLLKASTSIQ